jgi:hypothetical protein
MHQRRDVTKQRHGAACESVGLCGGQASLDCLKFKPTRSLSLKDVQQRKFQFEILILSNEVESFVSRLAWRQIDDLGPLRSLQLCPTLVLMRAWPPHPSTHSLLITQNLPVSQHKQWRIHLLQRENLQRRRDNLSPIHVQNPISVKSTQMHSRLRFSWHLRDTGPKYR